MLFSVYQNKETIEHHARYINFQIKGLYYDEATTDVLTLIVETIEGQPGNFSNSSCLASKLSCVLQVQCEVIEPEEVKSLYKEDIDKNTFPLDHFKSKDPIDIKSVKDMSKSELKHMDYFVKRYDEQVVEYQKQRESIDQYKSITITEKRKSLSESEKGLPVTKKPKIDIDTSNSTLTVTFYLMRNSILNEKNIEIQAMIDKFSEDLKSKFNEISSSELVSQVKI